MFKKAIIFTILCIAPVIARAENPFFSEYQNQVRIDALVSVDPYTVGVKSFFMGYAQPNSFLRLPGRRNIHLGFMNGTSRWFTEELKPGSRSIYIKETNQRRDISTGAILGLMQEVSLFEWNRFYFGVGMGVYFKEHTRDFVDSRFMVGERAFIGYRIEEHLHIEAVAKHFSNGHLTELNRGLNGVGVGITRSF